MLVVIVCVRLHSLVCVVCYCRLFCWDPPTKVSVPVVVRPLFALVVVVVVVVVVVRFCSYQRISFIRRPLDLPIKNISFI